MKLEEIRAMKFTHLEAHALKVIGLENPCSSFKNELYSQVMKLHTRPSKKKLIASESLEQRRKDEEIIHVGRASIDSFKFSIDYWYEEQMALQKEENENLIN